MAIQHAVLNDLELVYTVPQVDGRVQPVRIKAPAIQSVVDIVEMAYQMSIENVWIAPASRLNFLYADNVVDFSGLWDIHYSVKRNPDRGEPNFVKGITARRKEGTFEQKKQINITFPHWNAYQWKAKKMPILEDPMACLAGIAYLERSLGMSVHHNPGIMGRNIIDATNGRFTRPTWVKNPTFDVSRLSRAIAYDWDYLPGLQAIDQEQELYLHAWDKNSMFLGAASSVQLGAGNPLYVNPEEFLCNYQETMSKWFDGKKPGYWRIKYDPSTLPGLHPLYKNQEWVTTPLLKLILGMGITIEVCEAYVWHEHHRILDGFADILFNARMDIKKNPAKYPHPGGRQLAEYSLKKIATAGIGILGSKEAAKYAVQWFRPDWRAHVVEDAKARMIYKILQVYRLFGQLPVCVDVDSVYYLCTEPDQGKCFPGMFEREDKLGGWKQKHSLRATPEVLAAFASGKDAGEASEEIKRLAALQMEETRENEIYV